jgi:Domain of unknown function (DUF4884)
MTHFSKFILLSYFFSITIQSCFTPYLLLPKANNEPITYKVDFLFEHDGCKVYRFWDNGSYIYFTSCNGETIKVQTDSTGVKQFKSINKNN